jgi:hypothetical protein
MSLRLLVPMSLLCLAVLFPGNTEAKSAREKSGLIGPVHSIVEESSTWKDNEHVFQIATIYDTKGNRVESEVSSYTLGSPLGRTGLKSTHTYDQTGTRKEETSEWMDGSPSGKKIHTYDENGNRTEYSSYNAEGKLQFKWVSKYDDQGREIAINYLKGDGSLQAYSKTTYATTANGSMTSEYVYRAPARADGTLDYKSVTTFDEQGNRVEVIVYNGDGTFDKKAIYEYANGLATGLVLYNADGSIREKETTAYEFDARGNWIARTSLKQVSKEGTLSPEPPSIIRHTITYYK